MNYWIWLSQIEGLGPIKKLKLLEKFGTPEKIYKIPKKELLSVEGISGKVADSIIQSKDEELIKKYEAYILKNDISLINITDENYPENLRNIYAPPITLYTKGDLNLLKTTGIAVVGCRLPSEYGKIVSRKLSEEIASKGFTIISGLASGIDSIAHKSALKSCGKTIAVLGSGIDIVYPSENRELYVEIAEKGLIISEYIVGTPPNAENFPQRNRIISALSDGVLVIEAKKKSGTMITTDYALEQGKELYVIPGNITSSTSEGTNNLIKEGAKMVTSINDILEDFHMQ